MISYEGRRPQIFSTQHEEVSPLQTTQKENKTNVSTKRGEPCVFAKKSIQGRKGTREFIIQQFEEAFRVFFMVHIFSIFCFH